MTSLEDFLQDYWSRPHDHPRPSVTVDLVIFTVIDCDLKVLLIQRRDHPCKGQWALPGGFVEVGDAFQDQGEDLDTAAHRELAEETALSPEILHANNVHLEQLYTFGKAGRDPRIRVVSVAYYALVPSSLAPLVRAGDDAASAAWHSVSSIQTLAFDHNQILQKGVERIQGKIDYSPIAFNLLPQTFTVTELREVYEAIKGQSYDHSNFRRRFKRMLADGIIQPAPGKRLTTGKPASVYRFRNTP
jgi:8-oxo-dGTP diphosphatase